MGRKRALITGAARGIGRRTAEKFAQNGYDLILTCRKNTAVLEEFSEELREKYGISCFAFTGDMGRYSDVECLWKGLENAGKHPIDVIVNNAGISYIGLLTDMEPEEWSRIIATNLGAVFNVCHLFVPQMVSAQAGKIINVSSVWGNVGASCEVAYSASKGGVNAFTKALAKELAPSHVSVNAVAFGVIDTEMNQLLSADEKAALMEEIPACRMGTPEEAAEMIFHVASAPEYLTGQIITMDGGWI